MASLSDIMTGLLTWAPKGYREFIKQKPFMSVEKVLPETVALGGDIWDFLLAINKFINEQAIYLADKKGEDRWGPWTLVNGLRRGDCEDYAIHKLQALIANGFPRGACRLAICKIKSTGQYHCVLLVYETGREPLVLDNRSPKVLRKGVGATNDYEWIAEEFPGHGFWWRKLS